MHYRDKSQYKRCLCCTIEDKTAAYMISCNKSGRVKAFCVTTDWLDDWLDDNNTEPGSAEYIGTLVHSQGSVTITELCCNLDRRFFNVGNAQDIIEWRQFLVRMILKEISSTQH